MSVDQKKKKQLLRELLKKQRGDVNQTRRLHASNVACEDLSDTVQSHKMVLSYSSFGDEFCMDKINRKLMGDGKLVLPKVIGKEMKVYLVKDIDHELVKNQWGIFEPNPELCEEVSLSMISLVLVPAIGFDQNNHRIGYGGGYYDRFLSTFSKDVPFIGIGYKEQMSDELIPAECTDVPLSELFLY
jgi:5-formyltetrahydrofolate cyclo-ligase